MNGNSYMRIKHQAETEMRMNDISVEENRWLGCVCYCIHKKKHIKVNKSGEVRSQLGRENSVSVQPSTLETGEWVVGLARGM